MRVREAEQQPDGRSKDNGKYDKVTVCLDLSLQQEINGTGEQGERREESKVRVEKGERRKR